MCPPKPAQDNSAAEARQQEQERQSRITAGKAKIDESFGVFTPEYFDQFKGDYLNNYNPQVDDQFTDARKDLRYDLARAGTQDGTPGQKAFGDLTDKYNEHRAGISSKALEATNAIRTQVEQNKSDLYSQNIAAADPSLAAMSAAGRAGSLSSPPSFSPLGDLFSGAVKAGAAYQQGSNRALPAGYGQAFAAGAPRGGSSYVVG